MDIFRLSSKSEDHYLIQDIWFSLRTTFQLKQTFLMFWTKNAQKEYIRCKTKEVN